jgi:hypothetical protein
MKILIEKFQQVRFFMLITLAGMMLVNGCARYAHNVNTLYESSATVRGGSGEIYIVIPENRQSRSSDIKWVIGKVKNDDNNNIDEVFSPRSPAEIIQAAFIQEFKTAGYTVIATTKRPEAEQRVIDLTKTEIELEQISDIADLKAKCRIVVAVGVFRNGQEIKRLQYEASSSKIDFKDRDLLAGNVLQDTLQSLMQKAMPELHSLFNQ